MLMRLSLTVFMLFVWFIVAANVWTTTTHTPII